MCTYMLLSTLRMHGTKKFNTEKLLNVFTLFHDLLAFLPIVAHFSAFGDFVLYRSIDGYYASKYLRFLTFYMVHIPYTVFLIQLEHDVNISSVLLDNKSFIWMINDRQRVDTVMNEVDGD